MNQRRRIKGDDGRATQRTQQRKRIETDAVTEGLTLLREGLHGDEGGQRGRRLYKIERDMKNGRDALRERYSTRKWKGVREISVITK
jgi:hypothetical protein